MPSRTEVKALGTPGKSIVDYAKVTPVNKVTVPLLEGLAKQGKT